VISNQACANKYTITRTYRATDVCGNQAQCTQIITVNDVTAPVVTCPANITVITPSGSCTAVVNFTPTAADNCNGTVTIVSVPASGTPFPLGTTTVTSTATDACGNSSSCTFTVTVLDGQPPVVNTQPINRTVCASSTAVFNLIAANAVSYQWEQWNGAAWLPVPGANSASLSLPAVTVSMNNNIYRVKAIGLCTTVTSASASLFVNALPAVTLTAAPFLSLTPGQVTTLTATTIPTGGSYVWKLNGNTISGAGASSYGPLTVDKIGSYAVIYTDQNGCTGISAALAITGTPSENLWAYPSPNNGQFQVRFYNQLNEPATVRIFDATGQIVKEKALTTGLAYSRIDVDLGPNATGMYVIKVFGAGGKELAAKRISVLR
jgi:hypothetical protein